jgi:hypothetical protein
MEQTMDPHLPRLTTDQADRLRELCRAYFTAQGFAATVGGDAVSIPGQQRGLPLTNLSHFCRSTAPGQWPDLIEGHFSALLAVAPDTGGDDELLRGVRLRLLPDDFLPAEAVHQFTYLRPVAEGLQEALQLDAPDTVRTLSDADIAPVGLDRLREAGRANLVAEPVEHHVVDRPGGLRIHTADGSSMFVASKALVLDDLAREATGRPLPPEGALLTVPGRHVIAYHPIADHRAVDAINDLAAFGMGAYGDGPGQLSPRLYWWHAGALTSLTVIDHESREFSVRPPAELMDILRRLHSAG